MSDVFRADHAGSLRRPVEVHNARTAFNEGRVDREERLFGSLDVDRFLLEYDTERAGAFEPLRYIPDDKTVILGLVSSKEPALELIEYLLKRIDEASAYVLQQNLAISPQCGCASTAAGNPLTEAEQWRKLELVAEVAQRMWNN